ncbi:sialin-like [Macrobrachium rosenbergii]|uniref:sialin-like n=1 Tax=Macrobrachium rosenbergii TaxID=79674 RepID=UPI0034D788F5
MEVAAINDFLKLTFGWLPARIALALMAWLGFINLYMTRINVSVIIVAMVKRNSSSSAPAPCLVADNSLSNESIESPAFNLTAQPPPPEASFVDTEGDLMDWDETTQGLILGSFFYGYFLTQIPGGRLAEMYGTKWVFGLCILGGGIYALLSLVAARLHYGAFIFIRVIHGLLQGVSWPSMHACLAQWIPPFERPRFIGTVYFGKTHQKKLIFIWMLQELKIASKDPGVVKTSFKNNILTVQKFSILSDPKVYNKGLLAEFCYFCFEMGSVGNSKTTAGTAGDGLELPMTSALVQNPSTAASAPIPRYGQLFVYDQKVNGLVLPADFC